MKKRIILTVLLFCAGCTLCQNVQAQEKKNYTYYGYACDILDYDGYEGVAVVTNIVRFNSTLDNLNACLDVSNAFWTFFRTYYEGALDMSLNDVNASAFKTEQEAVESRNRTLDIWSDNNILLIHNFTMTDRGGDYVRRYDWSKGHAPKRREKTKSLEEHLSEAEKERIKKEAEDKKKKSSNSGYRLPVTYKWTCPYTGEVYEYQTAAQLESAKKSCETARSFQQLGKGVGDIVASSPASRYKKYGAAFFGWSPSTNSLIGVNFGRIKPKKLGWYAAARLTRLFDFKNWEDDADYLADFHRVETKEFNFDLTGGVTKNIAFPFAVYAGTGASYVFTYGRYEDSGGVTLTEAVRDEYIDESFYWDGDPNHLYQGKPRKYKIDPLLDAGFIIYGSGFQINAGIRTNFHANTYFTFCIGGAIP
ncbi:MAG: hypothetical protein LBK97_02965 [Prevotellaceae bacterium]|nr:hypothetical protein [Prevotellaceae bacterium]